MAEDTHIDGSARLKARLKRSRDYREKGYKHIKGSGRKKTYADLEVIQSVLVARGTRSRDKSVKAGTKAHARHYTFTYGNNFQIGQSPYVNQGHHLLPEEALTTKFFDSNQLRMLQGVDYDINNGENIMFLPAQKKDTAFHKLPYHSGSHPQYTNQVKADMKDVKDALDSALAKDKKHKEWHPPADLKAELMKLQNDYWNMLVQAGRKCLGSIDEFVKPKVKTRNGITKSSKS